MLTMDPAEPHPVFIGAHCDFTRGISVARPGPEEEVIRARRRVERTGLSRLLLRHPVNLPHGLNVRKESMHEFSDSDSRIDLATNAASVEGDRPTQFSFSITLCL